MLLEIEQKLPTVDLFFSLAFGYYKLKNYSLSFKYISKCLKIDPDSQPARVLLAKYYKKRGELNKSLELLLNISEDGDSSAEVNYLIAEIYRLKKFTNNAAEYYERVRTMLPEQSYLSRVVSTLKESLIQTR